uniref:Pheromone biosynthesis activating neuropeptide PBAN n=1 Tax=Adoxophyes sp. KSB-2001 TaxID=165538 RepID=Q962Y7_9NEOP|nr:pheromone biosynthesis activating neuropeptide PBAN precursor [Adoxophyes sp. KSB-2001]
MAFQKDIVFCLVVFNIVLMANGENFKEENFDRNIRSGRANVVFKPILGKRTSAENNRDTLLRMLEAADALKYYYDQLPYYDSQADDPEMKVTKKVIFTPKLGRSMEDPYEEKRSYDVDFTPRLGRRQSEAVTSSDEQVYRQDMSPVDGRLKYFSPRLGRTVKLTPRLGRSYNYEMFPSKIRLARSTNNTKST